MALCCSVDDLCGSEWKSLDSFTVGNTTESVDVGVQLPDGTSCKQCATSICLNIGCCAVRCKTSPGGIPKVTPDCRELSRKQVRGDVNVGGVHLEAVFSAPQPPSGPPVG